MPEKAEKPLVGREGWEVTGGFFRRGTPAWGEVSPDIRRNAEAVFWHAWSQKTGVSPGSVVSAVFRVPRFIAIPYTGCPNANGIAFYLECLETGERLQVAWVGTSDAPGVPCGPNWVERTIRMPRSWWNKTARLVVRSDSRTSYIGAGTPFRSSLWAWLKECGIVLVFIHALAFLLFVVPGVAAVILLRGNKFVASNRLLAFMPVTAFLGYALFFIAYYSHVLGNIFALAIVIGSLVVIVRNLSQVKVIFQDYERSALLMTFLFSLFYVEMLYCVDSGVGSWAANYRFAPAVWSSDNQLEQIVAEHLYRGTSIFGHFAPWKVSDRPQLLTGVMLLQRPFWEMFLQVGANSKMLFYFYQITGIVVVTFWVVPAWLFFRALHVQDGQIPFWLGVVGTNGFIVFNSIYIWPKLLAASLGLCAYLALLERRSEPGKELSIIEAAYVGFVAALAMLTHGAVVFGLFALAAVAFMLPSYRRHTGLLFLAGAVFLVTLAPWVLWQRFEDPSGNALIKFALAGTFGFGEEGRGVMETVRTAYSRISLADWLAMRKEALTTFFGFFTPKVVSWIPHEGALGELRRGDFLFTFPSFRFLNAGWIFWSIGILKGWWKAGRMHGDLKSVSFWLGIGVVGLVANGLLTWGTHINHHQSYMAIMLILLGLTGAVYLSPIWFKVFVLFGHFAYFVVVWLLDPLVGQPRLRLEAIGTFILVTAYLAIVFYHRMVPGLGKERGLTS
jgi:hypothetical protein